jgi:mannose-6-phosphate isomerase-like protein (cupin superfamily)
MEETFWLLGIYRKIIASSDDTSGQYDLIEAVAMPGAQTPPHIHHNYVETEYVLEGELTIYMPGNTVVLIQGEGYTIPKGMAHALAATGKVPTKTITVFAPGGFAEVIKKAGIAGKLTDGIPAPGTNMELFNRLSVAIGDVTLGPPGSRP